MYAICGSSLFKRTTAFLLMAKKAIYCYRRKEKMKNRQRLLSALLVSTAALSLQACGNNPVNTNELIIGLECNYAPFNWTENNANEFTLPISNHPGQYADGYDIQIAKLLGQKTGKSVKIVATEWTSLVPDLAANNINAIIAGMTDTEERRKTIDFTTEYYHSELVLVTSATIANQFEGRIISESEFRTFISSKKVISQVETVTDSIIDIFANNYGAIHATPLSSFALAATDVSNGSIDMMTAELPVANSIVSSFTNLGIVHISQSILGESQAELGVSIGIAKGNIELANALNEALVEISDSQRVELMSAAISRSTNK